MIPGKTGSIACCIAVLVLTGCVQSTSPDGGHAQDGAISGAVPSAADGTFASGTIGHMLDRQAQDLRASMANQQIDIRNTGSEIIVTMPEGILFDVDGSALRANLQTDIRALARNLWQYPDSTVDVIGHTDNTGSAAYNQEISGHRASAVVRVLLEQGIVSPSRVRTFGRGEDAPVATNLTPEGRHMNRRVEIIISPIV
ncbi:MAG: OmpA family protein [Rhodobacteraceae bacterium]|nr:OmpA family protein [Paracoccaceae bacterium]